MPSLVAPLAMKAATNGSCCRHPEESATRVEVRRSSPGPPARTGDTFGPEGAHPRLRTVLPRSGSRSYRPCPVAPRSDGAHTPLPSFQRALLPLSWCVHPNNTLERLRDELFVDVHFYVAHACPRRIAASRGNPRPRAAPPPSAYRSPTFS